MTWFIFAILTAFFESLKDVFSKQSLKYIDEYIVAWSLMFFSLPFSLPILLFVGIPPLNGKFWLALIAGGSLNIIATLLYIKAIKSWDLSITVPLVTFTPLFLLITSPLMVHEFPSLLNTVGIFLIVTGSYVLNLKERHKGYLAPFQALLAQTGPKLMLAVALIWSITSNFDKIGVVNSSPTFWAIAIYAFIAAGLFPIMLYKSHKKLKQIPKFWKILLPLGLFNALGILLQMQAVSLTLVAYVISIKRTSVLMSVGFGHFIFKEKGIQERSLGAAIMILGVAIISLF